MDRVTIRDVAALAGTSVATVSKVLNNVKSSGISEKTADNVRRAANLLQYVPSSSARSLRHQRTRTIGIIVPDMRHHAVDIVEGISVEARARQYNTVLASHEDNGSLEEEQLLMGLRGQVDGLIAMPARGSPNRRVYEMLQARGLPFVFADRYIQGYETSFVGLSNEQSAYRLTWDLINSGAKVIRGVFGYAGNAALEERYRGFRQALLEAGLIEDNEPGISSWGSHAGERILGLLSRHPPVDGLFWGSYQYIQRYLGYLHQLGIKIPQDIKVVGFDKILLTLHTEDDYQALSVISGPLPVAIQPSYEIGKRAAELLFARLEGKQDTTPQRVLLEPQFLSLSPQADRT